MFLVCYSELVTVQLILRPTKLISIFILIVVLFILMHPALAQDSSTSAKNRTEIRKENIAAMKDKMASRDAALKERLQAFKDKRKADIATRINTNLNKINQNQNTRMKKHLDKMSALLDKLEARVNQKSPDIKDPKTALAAIASARTSIASASSVVSAQAAKDYTLQVTSETTVRKDVQAVITQLKTDLQTTRRTVIDAKHAVANAIRVAKSGPAAKEGTPSGQQ